MSIAAYAEKNCSIAKPLSFLGERWTVLVLRDLFLGRRRFDVVHVHAPYNPGMCLIAPLAIPSGTIGVA